MTVGADSPPMERYVLAEPARRSDVLLGERYEVEFEAGTVTPKNEAEQHALEAFVAQGLAKRARKGKED